MYNNYNTANNGFASSKKNSYIKRNMKNSKKRDLHFFRNELREQEKNQEYSDNYEAWNECLDYLQSVIDQKLEYQDCSDNLYNYYSCLYDLLYA